MHFTGMRRGQVCNSHRAYYTLQAHLSEGMHFTDAQLLEASSSHRRVALTGVQFSQGIHLTGVHLRCAALKYAALTGHASHLALINGPVRANCLSEDGKVVKAQQPTIAEFGSPETGPKGTQTWPSRPA